MRSLRICVISCLISAGILAAANLPTAARSVPDVLLERLVAGAGCYYPQPYYVQVCGICEEVSPGLWRKCNDRQDFVCLYLAGITYNGDCLQSFDEPCGGVFQFHANSTCTDYVGIQGDECDRVHWNATIGGQGGPVNCP